MSSLEAFQRWLETKAHSAHAEYFSGPEGETLVAEVERCKPFTREINECRSAMRLLIEFKGSAGEGGML